MSAFSATLLALYVRDAAGHGQHVDVSAMETITVAQIHASIAHQFGVRPPDGRVLWRRRRMAGCMPAWSAACARTPGRVSVR